MIPQRGTADIDLNTITDRMAVRKAVQCGHVEDAIEKVNDLNPEVCVDPSLSSFPLPCNFFDGSIVIPTLHLSNLEKFAKYIAGVHPTHIVRFQIIH